MKLENYKYAQELPGSASSESDDVLRTKCVLLCMSELRPVGMLNHVDVRACEKGKSEAFAEEYIFSGVWCERPLGMRRIRQTRTPHYVYLPHDRSYPLGLPPSACVHC